MTGPTTRELIIRGARQHAERIAVIFGDETRTFAEVDRLSNQLAHALAAIGGGHRSRVGLLVSNGLLSVPVDFACVKAGVNRIPLNARLSAGEHAAMLSDTAAKVVVAGEDLADHARALAKRLPDITFVGLQTSLDGETSLLDLASELPDTLPDVRVDADDVILTLFTSGTTGTLKAAQHTQASYAGICRNVLLNLFSVQPDDVMLHAASLIHASGVFVLPFWLRGATTVILSGFEPRSFLASIPRYGATAINLVPTMIQMLVEHPDFETTDVSTLERVIYGASPMPRPTIERAMSVWGQHRFWQYYGQTEIPLALTVLRPEDHAGDRLAACGQISTDIELRLLDEQGNEVAQGEPGEIVVRGPSAVAGYHNAPELTAEMFRDGWVHTRDVGALDDRGFLFLKDRTSDMIVSGGYNVYPREVEDVLLEHPAVREVAVVGTPHPTWVETVTAVVVTAPGAEVDDALERELIEYVGSRIAGYKKPRVVVFADAIPKTAVGKLNRKALRAQLAEQSV